MDKNQMVRSDINHLAYQIFKIAEEHGSPVLIPLKNMADEIIQKSRDEYTEKEMYKASLRINQLIPYLFDSSSLFDSKFSKKVSVLAKRLRKTTFRLNKERIRKEKLI